MINNITSGYQRWQAQETPQGWFLIILSFAMFFCLDGWMALINNYSIERIGFDGAAIGQLQSVREIPGFMAFTAVYLLLWFVEQRLALWFIAIMGLGCALTGFFPSYTGLMITTLIMSIGFHYYETYHQSLSMQWISKQRLPLFMGKMAAFQSFAGILAYGTIWLLIVQWQWSYGAIYLLLGVIPLTAVLWISTRYKAFAPTTVQHRHLLLRKRYSLFYALTFLAGARRQIFVVFAGFLMVERFGLRAEEITLLFLLNHGFNMVLAPLYGRIINIIGERASLVIEYSGLTLIFIGYALVDDVWWAIALYIGDHMFFSLRIALKSYLQKIANPADIAATAAVSFTINHIAAVGLPVVLGMLWLISNSMVFYLAACLAGLSLLLAMCIPRHPTTGMETIFNRAIASTTDQ